MPVAQDKLSWRGQDLIDRDGEKVGRIEEIYLDAGTDEPEWALVHTGLFGTRQTFVPIREASPSDGGVSVPFDTVRIKDAPKIDADGRLSQKEEADLYRHYGIDDSETRADSGTDVSGPETDGAMTRSEEELRVGTTERETGRARLRKHIVSDQVTETVPVSREEVRIEREPITHANVDDALDGPELSEEEHEVTLRAEEPVVEKRVVPKERMRMDKETFTDERQVSEEVRREEVEVDGDADRDRR